ncbi:hypothetical protein DIS18_10890 [Algibacter marinivivus]|uniref:Uncharacterized protein n=1 Tax=Algibacter marinivivus TaxID=2100723 RepID=A0A2U2X4M5_9FLAO|nr:hypothetical protein [Algibacter marinivivus]PWH82731.1 hypothetical protein DIS18_10890 [Algibacter marinivivus]
MKKHLFKLFIALTVFYSCSSEDSASSEKGEISSNFTIMTNINDPLLAIYEEGDLKTYYYGNRDNNGIPLKINLVEITRPNDTTLIEINDVGRPDKIFAQNGVKISLDWLSDESASVVMISPNGEQQMNFIVDPNNISSKSSTKKTLKSNRKHRKIIQSTNSEIVTKVSSSISANKNTNNSNVKINISSCFEPANVQRVDLIVKSDVTGFLKGRFPAVNGTNNGEYYSTIPTSIADEVHVKEDICVPLAKAFNLTCDVATKTVFLDAFCTSMSAAIATSGIATIAAAPFFAACEGAVTELRILCIFNKGAVGGPTLASTLCNSQEFNRTFTESLKIHAVASGSYLNANGGTTFISATKTVEGKGPYPNLQIDLGSETSMSSLKVSPSVPNNEQDYTVSLDLFCVYQNTKVEFKVVGTDEYSDSAVWLSSTPSLLPVKNERFSFTVPGAESGVRDNITFKITLPNGTTKIKKASLVFG